MRLLIPLCAAICMLVAPAASADEVRMKDGDRYSGTVIQLDAGTLTFETAHGQLKLPWREVAALMVDQEIIVRSLAGQETRAAGSIDLATTAALERLEPAVVITGGGGVGLIDTAGNTDVKSLRVDGDLVIRARANRYGITAAMNRAEDNDVEKARNWTSSARYDRFLSPRTFLNANTILTNDEFRDLALRTAIGAGLGYQVANTARVKLSVDGGFGYVDENFHTSPDDSYAAAREAAKLDVFVVGKAIVFFHQHDGYFGVTGEDNLFVKTQNGVRLGLAGGLVTTARVDVDYDRTPAPGRRNTDRTFAVSLGYRF